MGTREGHTLAFNARATFSSRPPKHGKRERHHVADAPDVVRRLIRMLDPGTFARVVRDFYRDRVGWLGSFGFAVVLVYVGGAAMFWFHSLYLGEGGPAISPWVHWLLDSTAGLFGLTLPILLIVPVAAAAARGPTRVSAGWFGAITGTLLAVVTSPGPILHDKLIGRGTWLAAQIVEWFGTSHHHASGRPQDLSIPVRMLQQIAFGTPLYVLLAWITLFMLRLSFHLAERFGTNSMG
jgi:hypothetical protein